MVNASPERYFDLPLRDQASLLRDLAPVIGRRAEILEKDIWLCQVLGVLFRLPCRKPMAFKGGTSLSKVYKVIDRFSEDIDVTVDYRSLVSDVPDLAAINNSQRSKLSDTLKTALARHVIDELMPALQAALTAALPGHPITIRVSDEAEKLWVYYPSAVENTDIYVRPSILIEFGGRNSTLPQSTHTITSDIAEYVSGLELPTAEVVVLSAARTFWEKATLIHVECHRPNLRPGADRLSRHWYDLARLADHVVGPLAMQDTALLHDVLNIKETFYRSSFSHYDRCATGGLRLIPDAPLLQALQQDYQAMLEAQMFYGDTLTFDEIVKRLQTLQIVINSRKN
jgi:hypothetical protein